MGEKISIRKSEKYDDDASELVMGVPRLFKYILDNFPNAVKRFKRGNFEDEVDYLYLDANGLLHQAAQLVYNYGEMKRRINTYRNLSETAKRIKVYQLFFQNILQVTRIISPKKVLYIAIDGPAPLSKQAQQRQRRFVAARARMKEQRETGKRIFDSNCISPGTIFMHQLTRYMHYAIRKEMNSYPAWRGLEVYFSPTTVPSEGEHKCFAKGTHVLMWDGSSKNVEDLQIGDFLIGDNGTPRIVESLVSGNGDLFKVSQKNGTSYTVNKNHTLSLKIADHKRLSWIKKERAWVVGWLDKETFKYRKKYFSESKFGTSKKAKIAACEFRGSIGGDEILDISVNDYIKLSKSVKKLLYGYKCSLIRWKKQPVVLDPYILGLWLGDGNKSGFGFATADKEILDRWNEWADEHDSEVNRVGQSKYAYNVRNKGGRQKYYNPLRRSLIKYDLVNNKHIPPEYLVNDEETRLQLLAGLIDSRVGFANSEDPKGTDGNVTHKGRMVRFSQGPPNFPLFEDVVKLARSLGFKCTTREGKTTYPYKGKIMKSKARFLSISGDIQRIPTILPHKKCFPLKSTAGISIDRLRTKINIEPVGKGKYYGFSVNGNSRFLLDDCTVVHNCMDFMRNLPKKERENATHCMFGPDGDLIMLTLAVHIPRMFLFREDQYEVDYYHYLNMGQIRKELARISGQLPGVKKGARNLDDVTDDFIVGGFFVGNDFLPKIQMFHLLEDGLETMMRVYKQTSKGGCQLNLTVKNRLSLPGFRAFIKLLETYEEDYLRKQSKVKVYDKIFINHTLLQYIKEDLKPGDPKGRIQRTLDFPAYRQSYYQKTIDPDYGPKDIQRMCHDYLKSFLWILEYYVHGLPSWKWAYRWHYAPLMRDFNSYLQGLSQEEFKKISTFDMGQASLPLVQLLSILPPSSASLLPSSYRRLMNPEGELSRYYSDDFEIDYEGKIKEYQGIALLPFVDYRQVEKVYSTATQKIAKKHLRNSVGQISLFRYDPNFRASFTSDMGNILDLQVRKFIVPPHRL